MKKKKLIIMAISVFTLIAMSAVFFNASRLSSYTRYQIIKKTDDYTKYTLTTYASSNKTRCSYTDNGELIRGYKNKSRKHIFDIVVRSQRRKIVVKCTKGKGKRIHHNSNVSTRTLYLSGPEDQIKSAVATHLGKAKNVHSRYNGYDEISILFHFSKAIKSADYFANRRCNAYVLRNRSITHGESGIRPRGVDHKTQSTAIVNFAFSPGFIKVGDKLTVYCGYIKETFDTDRISSNELEVTVKSLPKMQSDSKPKALQKSSTYYKRYR